MFDNIMNLFKKWNKNNTIAAASNTKSKEAAKERLHLVLMQDRANVSADFLELMKQEIIDLIKKYIDVDESAIDVRLTNKENGDGTNGAPALYANIPILNIKHETGNVIAEKQEEKKEESKKKEKIEEPKTEKAKTKKESNEVKKAKNENTKKAEKENKEEQTKSETSKDTKQEEKKEKSETKKVKENKKEEKKDVKIEKENSNEKNNSEN